jgi:DNA (cytosine-5)-methyltransferase 1
MMTYGSVCTGSHCEQIAFDRALGWRCAFVSEIDPHAASVIRYHDPEVPNAGDFTTIQPNDYAAIDLLCGGTPCQAFSVAGLRKGFADERGNLTLQFLALADRLRPRWLLWENVPGVLSQDDGRAFGAFLGGLAELGYGFAYRVLDAQHFGVPQRRRRVFVVGYLGDWRPAAAVLFERESLRGDPPPRREAREGIAGSLEASASSGGGWRLGSDEAAAGHIVPEPGSGVAPPLTHNPYGDHESREGLLVPVANVAPTVVAGRARQLRRTQDGFICATGERTHALSSEGADASEDGTGRGTPIVAYQCHGSNVGPAGHLRAGNGNEAGGAPFIAFDTTHVTSALTRSNPRAGDPCHPLASGAHPPAIALGSHAGTADGEQTNRSHGGGGPVGSGISEELAYSLRGGRTQAVAQMQVRRLTPVECERLQGWPDGHTRYGRRKDGAVYELPDTQRYKIIGNGWALPVVRWIAERIAWVDEQMEAA